MPARNGTGPMGQGPRTGRGLGKCSPYGRNRSQVATLEENMPLGNRNRTGRSTFGRFFGRLFGRSRYGHNS